MKQISVFLENKPGTLNEFTKVLAQKNINMKALSLSESEGFGLVRFVTDDTYNATKVLKEAEYVHKMVDVIATSVTDEPGELMKILDILYNEGINIDYMYAFTGGAGDANFVLKVDDVKKGEAALRSKGIRVIV